MKLFRVGAKAVARVFGREGLYVCPICGRGFDMAAAQRGDLTLEHVPARSVGGKAIVLTCRRCNSTAGYTADAALSKREINRRFVEFMVGRRDEFEGHIGLRIGADEVRARVVRYGDGLDTRFEILGGTNNPARVEAAGHYMSCLVERGDATGETFTVSSGSSYDPRLAKVADLKAAFLAAFAALGYRYAFSSALASVRQQIQRPEEVILHDPWTVAVGSEDEFLMVLAAEPECLVVKLRDSGVLLPWLTSPEGFLDEVKARSARDGLIQVTGSPIEWPKGLHLVLDGVDKEGR
jgi:hypothetical protein